MENERMTEAFMDMAGRVSQELERVEGLLQTALRMLDDLNNRPYTGDYETDYNRNAEINDFIQEHKYSPEKTEQGKPDTDYDDLPF